MKQVADNNRSQPDPAFVERRLREMAEGLTEAIDKEVSRRWQEGLPIHVCENGKVIDLQESHSD
ncbi:MAG: hypothetical protein R3E58_20945 [Phycisphaerae bacterium]|nr:hypothetical protein [Phycisphaerales bacterium]